MNQLQRMRGFTLIELLSVLLILSLLGLMSYRGLGTVLDTRRHIQQEADKWRSVASFFGRFESDIALAAPRTVRTIDGNAPPWQSQPRGITGPQIEFSRSASDEYSDVARRLAYWLNEQGQIELWLWPALDTAPDAVPTRHTILNGVSRFELQYLGSNLTWTDTWPVNGTAGSMPKAVRMRLVLVSGEDIVRVFSVHS